MKKINSIHFGGIMIAASLVTGIVIPAVIWFLKGTWFWPISVAGALILLVFAVLFAIEMHQDNGKIPHYVKHLKETIPYDPEKQYPVIRNSICTGEKIAGFRDKQGNGFTEVMVIHNDEEKRLFMNIYDLTTVKDEY